MTSYTLQVQPQTQYTIEYANQRGPQGPTGPAGTGLSAIASGTILGNGLGDTALPQALNAVGIRTILDLATFDSPTFVGLTLTGLQQFTGTSTVGLRLKSLTSAEYNALTAANGDLFVDSTTDRIDARLARGTVELIDSAGGQTISGSLIATSFIQTNSYLQASTQIICTNGAGARINQTGIKLGTSGTTLPIGWTGGDSNNAIRTGLVEASNGVVEINNGTTGTLRDLSLRNLTASGTITATSSGPHIFGTGTTFQISGGHFVTLTSGGAYGWNTGTGLHSTTNGGLNIRNGANTVLVSTDASGNLTASGTVRLGTFTVGTLPSASANTRARAFVTDSNQTFNSANLGATVTAGGLTLVPVFSNGTNWVIG